jgi:hypothetical protein
MATWVKDPNSGGTKIPPAVQERTKQRILKYAEANYAGKYIRLDVRFRSQFCYIDAYTKPSYPGTSAPPWFDGTLEGFLEQQRSTLPISADCAILVMKMPGDGRFIPTVMNDMNSQCSTMVRFMALLRKLLNRQLYTFNKVNSLV